MIRVLIVDDHDAVRAGLHALFRAEPGLVPVAAVGSLREARRYTQREHVDVALVDWQLGDGSGLELCRRLKAAEAAPAIVIYSAFADARLALAAAVAGADGVVSKGSPAGELFDAVRLVARGRLVIPEIPQATITTMAASLEPDELALLGCALSRTDAAQTAAALRIDERAVAAVRAALLVKLTPGPPRSARDR